MVAPLAVSVSSSPVPPLAARRNTLPWNLLALVVALAGTAGSLWLSLGMDLIPCPLCYYQRAFVMGTAAVLLMSLLTASRSTSEPSLMAFPLAVAGCGVAGWHVYLESSGKLVCPAGLFEMGTAPQQSLAVQGLLVVVLVIALARRPSMVIGLVLGAVLAFACVKSVVPHKLPPEAYPPTICRPSSP